MIALLGGQAYDLAKNHRGIVEHIPWLASHPLGFALCVMAGLCMVWLAAKAELASRARRLETASRSPWGKWSTFGLTLAFALGVLVSAAISVILVKRGWDLHGAWMFYAPTAMWAVVGSVNWAFSARTTRMVFAERERAMRARLAPHFIFNALSGLKAEMAEDPGQAQLSLDHLSRLVRQALERADQPWVDLREEVEFVEGYLGFERMRKPLMRFTLDLPEELETAQVPPFSLQILVENALKHGCPAEGGDLVVKACQGRAGLELSVEDPGASGASGKGLGMALELLRSRLSQPGDLSLRTLGSGHTLATLRIRPRVD
jgi:hypothetical protein